MRYLISDIHGQYGVWRKARDFIKEDDTLYILGDVVDRGPDGIKILMEIIGDKQCKMLIGNHELMMVQACAYDDNDILRMWYMNGGEPTHMQLIQMLDRNQQKMLVGWINRLPSSFYLSDCKTLLTHAGFNVPPIIKSEAQILAYVSGLEIDDLVWDRSHVVVGQDSEVLMIHGHTSMEYISKDLEPTTPIEYQKGKIGIDVCVSKYKECVMYCIETKSVVRP